MLLLLFTPIFQGLALNVLKIPVLNYSVLMMLVSSKNQVGQPIYIVTPIIQILTVMLQFCNFPLIYQDDLSQIIPFRQHII